MTEQPTPETLLKCPFCGWEAEHRKDANEAEWPYFVKCSNCWSQSDHGPTPEAVAARWNMRVPCHD